MGVIERRRTSGEPLGELAIEIDQLLSDRLTLLGVGVQELRFGRPLQDGPSFHPRFQASAIDTFIP